MGRAKINNDKGLMTANEVAEHLIRSCSSFIQFKPYMFGSYLHGIGGDIDILVVGPTGERLLRLKNEIAIAGAELPLDVLYMDCSEEIETDFVRKQNCVPLLELAASNPGEFAINS